MSKVKWKLRNIKTDGVINLKDSLSRAGRLNSMQIRCISNLVSRNHANFFILEDGTLHVMDQDTTNGTFVNGIKIKRNEIIKLKSGDKVALGFDPTTDYEQIPDTTFYIFEVLPGEQPDPEIIIDSESDNGITEKECELLQNKECKLTDNQGTDNNGAKECAKDVIDIKNNKLKEKHTEILKSKDSNEGICSNKKENNSNARDLERDDAKQASERGKKQIIIENHTVETSNLLNDLDNAITEISNSSGQFLGYKKNSRAEDIINISEDQEINFCNESLDSAPENNEIQSKNVSLELKNLGSKGVNEIIKERSSKPNKSAIQNDADNQFEDCVSNTKSKRIEIKHTEIICMSSGIKKLEGGEEPFNKKNEKRISSKFDDDCGKAGKEKSSETINNNGLSMYKHLKVNVERLSNSKIESHKNSLKNKNSSEDDSFQMPKSVVSTNPPFLKRKNEDSIKLSTKKIKKDSTSDDNTAKSNKNYFNTQELFSVLTDSKESSNTNDSASKGPLTRSKSFNEKNKAETELQSVEVKAEPIKLTSTGFTNEDIIYVDNDEDDDSNFPCSQLFQSSQEDEADNRVAADECNNDDNLFLNIKKELEELDKTEFVPCVTLDSDCDSDWYSGRNKKQDLLQTLDKVVPDNFENNIEIQATTLSNKRGNEDLFEGEDEIERNLFSEEPHLRSAEESMKEVATASFYPAKKYVIPPIVEPHRVTSFRGKSSIRNEVENQGKRRRAVKTSPKYSTTNKLKDKLSKPSYSNDDGKDTKRDEIRKKIKEIATKKSDKNKKESIAKKGAVKVKVSEGRGQFLLQNNSNPVKTVRKVTTNNVLTKSSTKPSLLLGSEPISSKNISNLSNKAISNSTAFKPSNLRGRPRKNNLEDVTNKMPLIIPNALSSPEMKVRMDVSDIINQVIHWSASWLGQQRQNSYSPPVNKHPPVEMSAKFSSYNDYYNVVVPLLLLELWSSLYKDWSSTGNDSRKTTFLSKIEDEQVVNGYTIMKCFTYIDKEQFVKGCSIREDDLVVFESKGKHDNKTILRTGFGFVTFVNKRPVQEKDVVDCKVASTLQLAPDYCVNFTLKTKECLDPTDKGNIMFVRVVSSMCSYLRLFKSVKYLQFSSLKETILNPKIEKFKVNEVEPRKLVTNLKLNKSQCKAVLEATDLCLRKEPGIYLIQGPPGTGKTTVITSIIQEIIFSEDGPPRCVLLAAPSNGAVDELVKRLITIRQKLDDSNRKKFKVIRVGPQKSIDPKVYPFTLEHMAKSNFSREVLNIFPEFRDKFLSLQKNINELEKQCHKTTDDLKQLDYAKKEYEKCCVNNLGRKYFGELDKIRWSLLYNANVICTTLSSCFSSQMEAVFRNSGKITCCIVDEATQSNEQETLIPLMLGLQKIVLVGDPRQLCPTTLSQEAKKLKYGMSLFSRISNQFETKPDNPIVMLDTQYRMNPEISQFPSKTYYNSRLKNGPKCLTSKFKRLKPYVVFNLAMYCPMEQYRNEIEVNFILKLLKTIIELTSDVHSLDIGIITPYNNQRVKLSETLKNFNFRSKMTVVANTVDSFQGQEKDIIIVSYVRMDGNSFVSDEHRLNVALTRAKHALFIVGNKYLFDTCSVLKKIRDNAQRRSLLCIVDDNNTVDLKKVISHH